jgi:ligand-binding SRPBCC domain-containing protein
MNLTIRPEDRGYLLESTLRVPRPLEEVFRVFSDAKNLEQLTPRALSFQILTPDPIVMKQGLLLDYRLRLHGITVRWQSEISVWEPPYRFEDRQRKGPYRWWIHEHSFAGDDDHTVMTDRVKYGVPGGALVHRFFVARDLRKIFEYRKTQLCNMLGVREAECDGY